MRKYEDIYENTTEIVIEPTVSKMSYTYRTIEDIYVLSIDDEDEERSVGRLIVFINCWIGKDWLLPSLDLELH